MPYLIGIHLSLMEVSWRLPSPDLSTCSFVLLCDSGKDPVSGFTALHAGACPSSTSCAAPSQVHRAEQSAETPFHWALVSSVFPLCLEIVDFHGWESEVQRGRRKGFFKGLNQGREVACSSKWCLFQITGTVLHFHCRGCGIRKYKKES